MVNIGVFCLRADSSENNVGETVLPGLMSFEQHTNWTVCVIPRQCVLVDTCNLFREAVCSLRADSSENNVGWSLLPDRWINKLLTRLIAKCNIKTMRTCVKRERA